MIGLNGCVGLIRGRAQRHGMSKPKRKFAGKFSAGHVLRLSWPLLAFAFGICFIIAFPKNNFFFFFFFIKKKVEFC